MKSPNSSISHLSALVILIFILVLVSVSVRVTTSAASSNAPHPDAMNDGSDASGNVAESLSGPVPADAPVDFNGDGRSDYVLARAMGSGSTAQVRWFIHASGSASPTVALDWGLAAADYLMMEDFDGDNKDDVTIYRPFDTNGASFYILQSATNTARVEIFGLSTDQPFISRDYDGDGKADLALMRHGTSPGQQHTWFYRGSLNPNVITIVKWGVTGDFIVPGDYDGDGKGDFVIQRNQGGGVARFWRLFSNGTMDTVVFGLPTDRLVPGDYDGDGKTDIATLRNVSGSYQWSILSSLDGSISYYMYGLTTDLAVQGDYDGDGKTDIAVWRSSFDPSLNYFISRNSSNGNSTWFKFGLEDDFPVNFWVF